MLKNESVFPLKALLFCFHAANSIIVTFMPLYLQQKDFSGQEIGWVLAVGPAAAIIAQPFWGYMSDKYKTVKRMLLICISGLLAGSLLFFQADLLPMLLLLAAVFFFFISPVGALSDSLTQRKSEQLHINFGSIRTWGSIGFALSSLLVGRLLGVIGVENMVWPYFAFGVAAFIACLSLTDVKVEPGSAVNFRDINKLVKNAPFLIFLFLIAFMTITHRANDSFMGLYMIQLGGSEGMVGMAWFAGVASEALIFATAGYWFSKFHPLIYIIGAGLLYSTRWFIYSAVDDPAIIVALQFLHGFTFGVFYLSSFQYVSRLIPPTLQSTGHLVFVTVFFGMSGIIGSLVGGELIDTAGGSTLYFAMAWSALAGSLGLLLYHILPYGKGESVSWPVRKSSGAGRTRKKKSGLAGNRKAMDKSD